MTMQLIVHQGAQEIGGTVIELSTDQTKILLDIGQPLNKNSTSVNVAALKPDAALVSHPHQDHFGLLDQLDPSVPVYMGELSKNLISASRKFLGRSLPENNFCHFENGNRLK
jgi:ribonuclease J